MANVENRTAKNVAGSFYVDSECIGCGMCHEIAAEFFAIDDSEGTAFVSRQPGSDDETAKCSEAMTNCPVEAIGDDGDE